MPGTSPRDLERLEDIPNVGKAIAERLRFLGIDHPAELVGRDPYELYEEINTLTSTRHDPCLLDVFISAVRYVEGGSPQPWWAFTAERKATLAAAG